MPTETPTFIGQRYKDTDNGNIWIAISLTPGDWQLELQNCKIKCSDPSFDIAQAVGMVQFGGSGLQDQGGQYSGAIEFQMTHLVTGAIDIEDCPGVTDLFFTFLITIDTTKGAYFYVTGNDALTTVNFNHLTTSVGADDFVLANNPVLDSLLSVHFTTFGGLVNLSNNALTDLSLPELVTIIGNFFFNDNSGLVTFSAPNWIPTDGTTIAGSGCALNQASVDHILALCVANAGFVSGLVDLSGGTNSAPSASGLTDKATLEGRGVTVAVN